MVETRLVTFRIASSLYNEIERACEEQNKMISEYIRDVLRDVTSKKAVKDTSAIAYKSESNVKKKKNKMYMNCDIENVDEIEKQGWKMKEYGDSGLDIYYYRKTNGVRQYGCGYCGMVFKTLIGAKHHIDNCIRR